MCYELPYTAFAGDWSFTDALYGARPEAAQAYVRDVLRDTWRLSESDIARIFHIRSMVPYFLSHLHGCHSLAGLRRRRIHLDL